MFSKLFSTPQGGHRGHAQVLKFRFMLFLIFFLFLSSGWGRRCRHVGARWCRCGFACGRRFRNIGPLWGCCGRWGAEVPSRRGPNRALKFFEPSHPIIHLPIPSHPIIHLPIPSYTFPSHHTPSHTIIHLPIPSKTFPYHHTPSHTIIHLPIPSYTFPFHHSPSHPIIHLPIPSYTFPSHHTPSHHHEALHAHLRLVVTQNMAEVHQEKLWDSPVNALDLLCQYFF